MCTLIALYNLFEGAPIVAMHNRYVREGTLEYPPRVTRGRYRICSPIDVASGGTWMGFNDGGLFVAVTDQHSGEVKAVRRSRGKLVLDLLGDFSKAREATEYLGEEVKRGYKNGNFLVLDDDQGFHVIYDAEVTERGLKRGIHVITNITLLPEVEFTPELRGVVERAEARKRRALELATGIDTSDLEAGLETLQGIAADHGGGRSRRSICYHDERGEWIMASSTIVAAGRRVKGPRMLYCRGNPCNNAFLDYSHLMKARETVGGAMTRKDEKLAGG